MIQLYQAEWCPFSHRVRQLLTERGVPFVALQVEPEAEDRDAMAEAVGERSIPVAVLDDGTVLAGDTDEVLAELDRRHPRTPHSDAHRERRWEARAFE